VHACLLTYMKKHISEFHKIFGSLFSSGGVLECCDTLSTSGTVDIRHVGTRWPLARHKRREMGVCSKWLNRAAPGAKPGVYDCRVFTCSFQ